jgi:hypothetical protein
MAINYLVFGHAIGRRESEDDGVGVDGLLKLAKGFSAGFRL